MIPGNSTAATPRLAIICVDDEAIILLALKQELRSAFGDTFEYETAADAAEGLDLINELQSEGVEVVLVISDWSMPGLKGDEFLIQVRERCPTAGTVMITGYADEDRVRQLQDLIPDAVVLPKPWSSERLRTTVKRCIDRNDNTGTGQTGTGRS